MTLCLVQAIFKYVAKYGWANLRPVFAAGALQPVQLRSAQENGMDFLKYAAVEVIHLTEPPGAPAVFGVIHHGKEQSHKVV